MSKFAWIESQDVLKGGGLFHGESKEGNAVPSNIKGGSMKSYVLIDNFDKVDIHSYAASNGSMILHQNEVLFPFAGMAYDYKFFPNVGTYTYLPDMFRFLTGRRFAYRTLPGSLIFSHPSSYDFKSYDTFKDSFMALENNAISITELEEKINKNYELYGSPMKFDYYFDPPGLAFLVSETVGAARGPNQFSLIEGDYSKDAWNTAIGNMKDYFFNTMADILPPQSKFLTLSSFQELASQSESYKGLPVAHIEYFCPDPAGNTAATQNILTKVISWPPMFKYNNIITRAIDQIMFLGYKRPNGNVGYPKHTYFVCELPIGIEPSEAPEEFKYTHNQAVVEMKPYYNFYKGNLEAPPDNINLEYQLPNIYAFSAFIDAHKSNYSSFMKIAAHTYYAELCALIDASDTSTPEENKALSDVWLGATTFTFSKYINAIQKNSFPKPTTSGRPITNKNQSLSTSLVYAIGTSSETEGRVWPAQSSVPLPVEYRYRTIIMNNKNVLASAKELKKATPYGVEISLPTQPSEFLKTIHKDSYENADAFLSLLAGHFTSVGKQSTNAHRFILQNEHPTAVAPSAPVNIPGLGKTLPGILSSDPFKLTMADLQIFDLHHLFWSAKKDFDFYGDYARFANDLNTVKFLDESIDEPFPFVTSPNVASSKQLQQQVLEIKSATANYIEGKKPSMKEVLEGKSCHSEIIAFEIAKYKRARVSGAGELVVDEVPQLEALEHVQSIYIPNRFEADFPLSYLDTQVFYKEQYVYKIYAITLIVGASYSYRDTSVKLGMADYKATEKSMKDGKPYSYPLEEEKYEPFDAYQRPIIVRAPYYNTGAILGSDSMMASTMVVDSPPLPPEISFNPYKDSENALLLLLNQNYGQKLMIPNEGLFAEDAEKINNYKISQKHLNNPKGHVLYKNDDGRGTYEIYRLGKKPENWSDFRDAEKITLDSATQSGYRDFINSNKDYYYCSRFVDIHKNISNPTSIFKVRIVNEEGFPPYMILKEFNLKERKVTTERTFKKFLRISLNDEIREITSETNSVENATINYSPNFGDAHKTYKFRITSKKTGKKIDFNVNVKKKTIKQKNLLGDNVAAIVGGVPVALMGEDKALTIAKAAEEQLGNLTINIPEGSKGLDI